MTSPDLNAWISPRRWRFWLITLFLVYTLGGFFLAPWLLERLAVNRVAELGRTLTIETIKVNPFILSIEVGQTEFYDTDGELLFSYDTYFWNFQLSSLFRRAWTFSEIRLDGLWLNLERFRPGEHRMGRLIDAFPNEPPQDDVADTRAGKLPRLIIHDFQLNGGHLLLKDVVDGQEFQAEYGPINVHVQNLSTLPDISGEQRVSIATSNGGSIAWSGTVQIQPFQSRGHFSIQGKSMEAVYRYLALHLPFTADGEAAEFEFDYRVQRDATGELEALVENLSGQVHGLRISLANPDFRLVELPLISFKGATLRWPQKELSVATATVSRPRLNLQRSAQGELDIQQLFPPDGGFGPGAGEPTDEPRTAGSDGWRFTLDQLGVEEGVVVLEDQAFDPPAVVGVSAIDVNLEQVDNRPGSVFPTRVSLELASGGLLEFSGDVAAIPHTSAKGRLAIEGLQLGVVQPWLSQWARVSIESGELSLSGDFSHGPEEPGAFAGPLRIMNFTLNDTLREEQLAGWSGLETDRVELSLAGRTLKTSEVGLREPYGRLAIARDKTTNLGSLMISQEDDESPGPGGESTPVATEPLSFLVSGVDIEEARLDFSDLSLPLPFAVAIRSLDGSVSTLSNNSTEPARIELEGQVNEYGSAQISGVTNAWDYTDNTDIQMKFRNLEMADLTPYSIQFAGHEIQSGRLDLDLDYEVKKGQMLGDNKIIARQLTIGDKVEHPDAVSLPLKLAVALLKDSNGVIDVDVPVSGDLNDPEFRIGGVVMKALFNLLTKIVTSPFRLLGSLVGVDSEDFGTLSFEPGEAEVSPPDREKLVRLAEAMVQRPELELSISGVYAEERDRAALKLQKVDARLETLIEEAEAASDTVATTLRRQATESLFLEIFPDITLESVQALHTGEVSSEDGEAQPELDETAYVADLRRQLIEHENVSQEELEALAHARADAVMSELESASPEQPLALKKAGIEAIEAEEEQAVPLELSVAVSDSAPGPGEE